MNRITLALNLCLTASSTLFAQTQPVPQIPFDSVPNFLKLPANLYLGETAGVAVNSNTKRETFMKMISAGAGLGIGVKDYRVIFVFENDKAFNDFLNSGWSGSGQADAAAKAGDSGGAYSGATQVSPGVWVYQITKNGLALQLTLQGTKYYKDDDLNKKT